MKDGIGEGRTRADHPHVASQLYASYARVQDVRSLASVIGEEELTATDRQYLAFGKAFEQHFVAQGMEERRTVEDTLNLGWQMLSLLPREELTRLSEKEIESYYGASEGLSNSQ